MKAIIKMVDGDDIEVIGEDLNIETGLMSPSLEVVDRAFERVIFSANKANVKYAFVWPAFDVNDCILTDFSAPENK